MGSCSSDHGRLGSPMDGIRPTTRGDACCLGRQRWENDDDDAVVRMRRRGNGEKSGECGGDDSSDDDDADGDDDDDDDGEDDDDVDACIGAHLFRPT